MSTKCDECCCKFSVEQPRVIVQYISGDYESCRLCVDRKIEEGLIVELTSDFLVGHRKYYKGLVGIGVLDHIKTVFNERRRDAS